MGKRPRLHLNDSSRHYTGDTHINCDATARACSSANTNEFIGLGDVEMVNSYGFRTISRTEPSRPLSPEHGNMYS